MTHPDLSPKEPPSLPVAEIKGFALNGDYNFRSPANTEGTLRSSGIRSRTSFGADAAGEVLAVLRDLTSYGGDGARCFIPRHALRFSDSARTVDVLFCLECHWVYFFYDAKPEVFTLSKLGECRLEELFAEILKGPERPSGPRAASGRGESAER